MGGVLVTKALRAAGLTVVTMAEHYGEAVGQQTADVDWIADVAGQGWVAFHKDANIRRNAEERAAVSNSGLRMFVITNANITAAAMTDRYLTQRKRISGILTRESGPFIYGVYENEVKRLHPPLSG